MTTNNELQEKIIEQTNTWYHIACDYYHIAPKPLTIEFELKNSRAGEAWLGENKIRYNLQIAIDNEDEFIKQTVPHEVAHLITKAVYPRARQYHGPEWKSVMMRFGLEPKVYHSFDVSKVTRRIYKYTCACNNLFQVGKNLHTKLQNGSGHRCGTCKSQLVFVGE